MPPLVSECGIITVKITEREYFRIHTRNSRLRITERLSIESMKIRKC